MQAPENADEQAFKAWLPRQEVPHTLNPQPFTLSPQPSTLKHLMQCVFNTYQCYLREAQNPTPPKLLYSNPEP